MQGLDNERRSEGAVHFNNYENGTNQYGLHTPVVYKQVMGKLLGPGNSKNLLLKYLELEKHGWVKDRFETLSEER